MRFLSLIFSVPLIACTSNPETCAPVSLAGTWQASYEVVDGDCGALPPAAVTLNDDGLDTASTGCAIPPASIPTDSCNRSFSYTCNQPAETRSYEGVVHLETIRQLDVTISTTTVDPTTNKQRCRGTYRVTYTR